MSAVVINYDTYDSMSADTNMSIGDTAYLIDAGTYYGYTATGWLPKRTLGGSVNTTDATSSDTVMGNDSRLLGNRGTAVLDFGAWPGKNSVTLAITGQPGILAGHTPRVDVQPQYISNANGTYTALEVSYLSSIITLNCDAVVPGTGFTIYAFSTERIQGPIPIIWSWR